MSSITITIPLPERALSPNTRVHWSRKAKAVKRYRRLAWAASFDATPCTPERWAKASVAIVAYYPTRRHPDPDNLIASLKAAFDGIADAGIVANDRGLWPERPAIFTDRTRPRIELTITEEP
jgi:crossover junction endodeoxyribonuclease RusA